MAVLPLGAAVTPFTSPALLHTLRYLTPRPAEATATASARARDI